MKKVKRYLAVVLIMAISCLFLINDTVTAKAAGADFYDRYSGDGKRDIQIYGHFKLGYKCKLNIKMEFPYMLDYNSLVINISSQDNDTEDEIDGFDDGKTVFEEEICKKSSPYTKTITLPAGQYYISVNGETDYWEKDGHWNQFDGDVPYNGSYPYALILSGEYAPVLSNTTLTLEEGKTKTLKIKGSKKSVVWKSLNRKIATVSAKGLVKAKKPGKTTITATCGQYTLKCKVTVKKKPVTYSQMAKKMKTFARKNRNFTYKTIDVGRECRLYGNAVYGKDTSKAYSRGVGMAFKAEPYIQLVKKGRTAELRLRVTGILKEYSINPTRLLCDKLKMNTSNRRMNFTMVQTYGRNLYNYSSHLYDGEIRGYATISTSSKVNSSGLKKLYTMLGQRTFEIKMVSRDGTSFQENLITKSRNNWKKLVKEYNTLLKEF